MEGASTVDVINGDVFFEIIDPAELEYTYRIRPAKDFGAPFVCTKTSFFCIDLSKFFRMLHFI